MIDPVSVRRAASWGNAGHIATEQVEPLASAGTIRSFLGRLFVGGGALALPPRDIGAWLPFAMRLVAASQPERFERGRAALERALAPALPAWRRLLAEAGAPHLLREEGHYVVWQSARSAAAGRQAWARTATGQAWYRDATPEELSRIAAQTSRAPVAGIRFFGSGQIVDLEEMSEMLAARLAGIGGEQRCARVQSLKLADARASVILEGGEDLSADAIVIAAGTGSKPLLESIGYRVPIIAERGYHIQSALSAWPQDLPPVVFEDHSMIVTRFRSALRAASFVEFARSDSPPDPRKWKRLRAHICALGLPFEEPLSEWMGSRPTLPDYLPAIGRSGRASNLFYGFGHQHLGLTLAAVTGEAVADLVTGETPAIDLDAFDLRRFQKDRR